MEKAMGYIYILTNPSFPDYIKIGYADNVERRLNQLNNSECTPFAFRVFATYEVDSRLSDLRIHAIIDKLNPNLRSIDTFNGKRRIREFYAMDKEDAYDILEAIAEIHNCTDKLRRWEVSEADAQAERMAEEVQEKRRERVNFSFDELHLEQGQVLTYIEDPTVACTIADSRRIIYQGERMYLTPFARLVSGNERLTNGPGWVKDNFLCDGELLRAIERHIQGQ